MINETVGDDQENGEQCYAFDNCGEIAIATGIQPADSLDEKKCPAEQEG